MSTSLPSLMTRRKKIPGIRVFDQSKVLADFNPTNTTHESYYRHAFGQDSVDTKQVPKAGIVSKPDPNHICFLYENPRFINEPICLANTQNVRDEQKKWWPENTSDSEKPELKYDSESSTNRSDYRPNMYESGSRLTRFGSNPHRLTITKGIVPVNAKNSATIREKVSFEHQFDSRKGRTERGKLKGSFVWHNLEGDTGQLQDKILRRIVTNNNHKCNEWYYHL